MENTETRVTRLEEKNRNLEEKVDSILTNHLPHLQKGVDSIDCRIDSMEKQQAKWGGAIIVIGFVTQFLVQILLKLYFN